MVNRLSMYSHSKLDYSQLKGPGSAEEAVKQVEAKADELYTRALEAMKGYQPLISALTGTLLERYVLSKDEVFALLADMTEPRRKVA
jgi:cell division protease FtsH